MDGSFGRSSLTLFMFLKNGYYNLNVNSAHAGKNKLLSTSNNVSELSVQFLTN